MARIGAWGKPLNRGQTVIEETAGAARRRVAVRGDALPGDAAHGGGVRPRRPARVSRPDGPPASPPLAALEPAPPRLGFVLFLMVNAVLFIRPAEIFPSLQQWPIYEVLMIGSLVASFPAIVRQFFPSSLLARPQTVFVVGILFSIFLSQIVRGQIFYAREGATEFLKVLLFFLLLLGLVTTPKRLRVFLVVTSVYIVAIAALALAHHHGIIHLDALTAMAMREGYSADLGERVVTVRLQASGIFHDPNDFSLILGVGLLVLTHLFLGSKNALFRAACVAVACVDFYALVMTRSRGGLLALLAGMGVMLVIRFGWRRAMALGALGLPLLLVAVGGRQTNFNFEDGDTGHGRVAIWRDGIAMFKASPLFGAGVGQMARELRIVAHNSFVHAFTELGLIGGPLFLGVFYVPVWMIRRAKAPAPVVAAAGGGRAASASRDAAELRAWRPCILALMAAYVIGLCSLSRPYTVTTYLILGVAGAYANMASARGLIAAAPGYGFLARKLAVLSVGFLVCLYLFVNLVL